MSENEHISDVCLIDLVAFLNAGLEPYGDELEFAERNNVSLKIINSLYASFQGKFERWLAERNDLDKDDCKTDVGERDNFESARSVAIKLRDFFRRKYSISTLDRKELSQFSMLKDVLPGENNRACGVNLGFSLGSFVPNADQIQSAADFMSRELVEYVEFDKLIADFSEVQGYTGMRSINGFGLPLAAAESALRATLPDVSRYDRVTRGWDVIDRARIILYAEEGDNA